MRPRYAPACLGALAFGLWGCPENGTPAADCCTDDASARDDGGEVSDGHDASEAADDTLGDESGPPEDAGDVADEDAAGDGGETPVPVPVDAHDVGGWGMLPKLIPGPDGNRIYLFYSAPDATVRIFDVAGGAWLPDTLVAPETGNTYVRWSRQDYAVDTAGNLHVVWGDRGTTDCRPATPEVGAPRVKHIAYSAGAWGGSETLAERFTGDPACTFQNVALSSDGAGRLLAAYQVAITTGPGDDDYTHPKRYRIRDGGTWTDEALVGDTRKSGLSAGGGAGSFFISYMTQAGSVDTNVAVIPPGGTAITDSTRFEGPSVDAEVRFFVESSGVAYVAWTQWDQFAGDPQWHASGILYNHRVGGAWAEGNPGTTLAAPPFFGSGSPTREEDAPVEVAVSAAGTKLVVFSYMTELYFRVDAGGGWGPLFHAEVDVDVRRLAAAALGPRRFLVVWSTGDFAASATLHWAVLDV